MELNVNEEGAQNIDVKVLYSLCVVFSTLRSITHKLFHVTFTTFRRQGDCSLNTARQQLAITVVSWIT